MIKTTKIVFITFVNRNTVQYISYILNKVVITYEVIIKRSNSNHYRLSLNLVPYDTH